MWVEGNAGNRDAVMAANRVSNLNVVTHVTSRQHESRKYDCAQCSRAAAVRVDGVLVIKNHHNSELHTNAFAMNGLFRDYIADAPPEVLKEMQRTLAARLSDLGIFVGS